MDENTRRQITWLVIGGAVLSLVILASSHRGEVGRLRNNLAYGTPAQRLKAVERLVDTAKLAEAVTDQPRWVQDNAVDAVALLGTEKAIYQLMSCWTVVDAPVQPRIQSTVARFGPLAIPPLVEALTDKDAKLRAGAPGVLTAIGEPTIPYLLPLMGAWDDYIRTGVATVFGGVGKPVTGELVKILEQPMPASKALATGSEDSSAVYSRTRDCAITSLLNMKLVALDALTKELLVYRDPEVRGQAATMLGTIGAGLAKPEEQVQVIPALVATAVNDQTWAVRRKACSSLGLLGQVALDNGVAPVLMGRLSDQREEVIAAAAEALGKIKAAQAAPQLAQMLITRTSGASREISVALIRIGDASVAPLWSALNSPSEEVRLLATQTVAEIGGSSSIAFLAAALRDTTSAMVREVASDALRNAPAETLIATAGTVIPALAAALTDKEWQVYSAARDALAKIGAPAVPSLVNALNNPDPRVGYMAEMALTRIGAPAVPGLVNGLMTGSDLVANWASVALGEIAEPAIQPLKAVIANAAAPVRARAAAATALGATRMNEALQPLEQAAKAAEPQVRVAALQGLTQLGMAEGTEFLVAGLSDAVPSVRETAMNLLKNWRIDPVTDLLWKVTQGADVDAKRRAAVALVFEASSISNMLLREMSLPSGQQTQRTNAALEPILTEAALDASTVEPLRQDAIVALGYVGNDKTVGQLQTLLKPDDKMVLQAARAIAMIGFHTAAIEQKPGTQKALGQAGTVLLNIIKQPEAPALKLAAAAALSTMQDIPVDELLKQLAIADADAGTHAWCAAILVAIGKPAAEKILHARGDANADLAQRQWLASTLQAAGDVSTIQLMRYLPENEKPQMAQADAIQSRLDLIRKALAS